MLGLAKPLMNSTGEDDTNQSVTRAAEQQLAG